MDNKGASARSVVMEDIAADEIIVRLEGEIHRLKKSNDVYRHEEQRLQTALRQAGFRINSLVGGMVSAANFVREKQYDEALDRIAEVAGSRWYRCPYCGEDCDWPTYQDHMLLCQDGYSKLPKCPNCYYVPEDLVDNCPMCNTPMPKGRA